jgi:hypothetical protein
MRMRHLLAAGLAVLIAAAASAQGQPPTGWDGVNPFRCELQQAGFEPEGPDPGADPYCVEFDKRRQNVSELGIVEFLSLEPARVGAAGDKCFYFQADHWRSSVVQDDGATKVYEWDGHYFFDKATGDGGAWVTNFNVNGQTGDPSQVPGIPPEYAQHMGPGTGGAITRNAVDTDPACVARAQAAPEKIYADRSSAAGPGGGSRGCVAAAGTANRRRLGPVRIGARDRDVRAALGDPERVHRGFMRYCADGGGVLLVGQPGDRSGELGSDPDARTVMVLTTSPRVRAGRVRVGARAPRHAKRIAKLGRTGVVRVRPGVLAGVRARRVRWLAVRDARRVTSVRRALDRALSG